MIEDIRRRTACDRCHSQKLRCPKRPGADICERCLKAKASCSYSPFRQKKPIDCPLKKFPSFTDESSPESLAHTDSPGSSHAGPAVQGRPSASFRDHNTGVTQAPFQGQQSTTIDEDLDLDLDFSPSSAFAGGADFSDLDLGIQNSFPAFNFNPLSHVPPDFVPKQNNLPFLNRSPNLPSQNFPSMTEHQPPHPWEQPLVDGQSSISVTIPMAINWKFQEETLVLDPISKCVARLSRLSTELHEHATTLPCVSEHNPDSPCDEWASDGISSQEYRVDETFRVTQEMIDVYPTILNLAQPSQPASSDQVVRLTAGARAAYDHSTVLLALSCHLRLIGIYETLFTHMGICVQMRGTYTKPAFKSPGIKIGSFTPPPSSALPMQMLLIVHLTSQLSSYAAELVARIRNLGSAERMIEEGNAETSQDVLLLSLSAAESVSKKANEVSKTISFLRSEVLNYGLLA